MVTQKHFKTGSTCPELSKGTLRIYSMRFCPFAQRTHLVLIHKGISHETVNIDLKQKPEWFLKKNPQGQVPVLEQDDKIIPESAICDDYLEDVYPEKPLYPKDPFEKGRHKILMEQAGKVVTLYYQCLQSRGKKEKLDEQRKLLDGFEAALKDDYFAGSQLGMVDIHLWPWVERFPAAETLMGATIMPIERFPKMHAWRDRMLAHPTIKAAVWDDTSHLRFYLTYARGKPCYDLYLEGGAISNAVYDTLFAALKKTIETVQFARQSKTNAMMVLSVPALLVAGMAYQFT